MKKIIPKVLTYSILDHGKTEVEIKLKTPQILTDINIKRLEAVIKNWKQRNIHQVDIENDQLDLHSEPQIIFPLSVGQTYQNTVSICRIDNAYKPLTLIEKFILKKHVFKFTKVPEEGSSNLETQDAINILTDEAINIIRKMDRRAFDRVFEELSELYSVLIELGETKDEKGNPINYSIIETSWFGETLHENWARSYKNIFEESLVVLEQDDHFLRKCSYTAYNIAYRILNNPSMTGLNSIIRAQGYLWFKLNSWWIKVCGMQNKEHSLKYPTTLSAPLYKTHKNAVISLIQGWEALNSTVLSGHVKEIDSWKRYKVLFEAFEEHLNSTVSFLAYAVLSGNKDAAILWADSLIRWNSTSRPVHHQNELVLYNNSVQALITPVLLSKSWKEVTTLLNVEQNKQELLFSNILQNYWQDACYILSGFLLQWSIETTHSSKTLAVDIIKHLIKGQTTDGASVHRKKIFIENFSDYLSSFIRRNTTHRWDKGTYGSILSSLADRLDRLNEPERIAGRPYISSGSSIEKIDIASIVIATFVKPSNKANFDQYNQLIGDEKIASQLKYEIESKIKLLSSVDAEKYSGIYNYMYDIEYELKESTDYEVKNESGSDLEVSKKKYDSNNFQSAIKTVESALLELKEKIDSKRLDTISSLDASDLKLNEISKEASQAFDEDTEDFPINQFEEVELVTEPGIPFKLSHNNFPKGQLTDPLMDDTTFREGWHRKAVASNLYPYLVLDIFEEAKENKLLEEVIISSEQEYADKIIELSYYIKQEGLTPILIAEDFRTPKWLLDWEHAIWRREATIPQNIKIEKKDKKKRGGYLFDISEIPVYEGMALVGGTLLLPKEILERVNFTQQQNGYPVEVIFEKNSDNPWHGTLTYNWERAVELNKKYKIFILKYPSDIGADIED